MQEHLQEAQAISDSHANPDFPGSKEWIGQTTDPRLISTEVCKQYILQY